MFKIKPTSPISDWTGSEVFIISLQIPENFIKNTFGLTILLYNSSVNYYYLINHTFLAFKNNFLMIFDKSK